MTLEFDNEEAEVATYQDGENPLELFVKGDTEMRGEIILNHPDVIGFVYINDDVITKAFLPKKMVNFKTNTKIFIAVSGDTEDFAAISAQDKILLSDSLHLTDFKNFAIDSATISIGKHVKDNEKKLPSLPNEFSTAAKIKALRIIAFPLIIPIVKGYDIPEGDIDEIEIYDKFCSAHHIYADWIFLQNKKYVLNEEFFQGEGKCPIPEKVCDNYGFYEELPFKTLFKSKKESLAFNLAKSEVQKFILQNKPIEEKSSKDMIPEEVNVSDINTVATNDKTIVTNTSEGSSSTKNEKLQVFFSILFAKPLFDRKNELVSLIPSIITDEIKEIISSSSSTSEQSRELSDSIEALADDVSRERCYLSRAAKFPFLSTTLITYILQAHYHSGPMDNNLESLKKSFSILSLLPPPMNTTDEYNVYINSSKNQEVENMLDQPSEKRASVKKEVFIKGKQETLDDVIAFISNIVIFARHFVKMSKDDKEEQPYFIQLIIEVADFLSSAEYTNFHDKFKKSATYMPHTLITYIFNIFSVFIKMAKNPKVIRKFKVENIIDPKEIKIGCIMHDALLNQLQLCTATSSVQNIFATPTLSFKIFCPTLHANSYDKPTAKDHSLKRNNSDRNNDRSQGRIVEDKYHDKGRDNEKRLKSVTRGSIINTTGRKLHFPQGLEHKYCSDFLDAGENCRHGEKCHFEHVVYPGGFSEKDKLKIDEFIKKEPGLSFNPANKNVSTK